MNKLRLIPILLLFAISSYAQKRLPKAQVKNLKYQKIELDSIIKNNGPVAISFWASWCKPCIEELNAINENIEELKEKYNFKLIGITIDDSRSLAKVRSITRTNNWDFDIYIDQNQELKRKLGISRIPFLLLLNNKGEIIWKHNSYTPGSEELLFEKIKEASNKTKI
ncbi:MAG: TlpA family protein disulfide reductase [Marinifilaceae bacterium]|jgi:thiol-disulfide isomerase/thioredoxin|nr:TlpA family protein disulfide reductase [Marinifilaceae bacterium]